MVMKSWSFIAGLLVITGIMTARAEVKVPALFSDNAVLQQEVPLPF